MVLTFTAMFKLLLLTPLVICQLLNSIYTSILVIQDDCTILYLMTLLIETPTPTAPRLLVALHFAGSSLDSFSVLSEQIILCRPMVFCWFSGSALDPPFFSLHTLSLSSALITPKFLLRARWSALVVSKVRQFQHF